MVASCPKPVNTSAGSRSIALFRGRVDSVTDRPPSGWARAGRPAVRGQHGQRLRGGGRPRLDTEFHIDVLEVLLDGPPARAEDRRGIAARLALRAKRKLVEKFLKVVEARLADQLFWSQYAVAYDRVLMRYPGYIELVRMHCGSVQKAPPGRVLDLGAGTGNITLEILKQCPERRVIVVDYNQSMLYHLLRKCRTFENRMEIRFEEVEQLPDLTRGSVAAVVMNNVLMFLKEPSKMLKRVYSWLMDGGVISLHVANQSALIDTLLSDLKRKLKSSGDFSEVSQDFAIVAEQNREMFSVKKGKKEFWTFSPEEMTRLLNEAGFTVEYLSTETYAGTGLYALATKRKAAAPTT